MIELARGIPSKTKNIDGIVHKKCNKCSNWKIASLDYFPPFKNKLGLHAWCRDCSREYFAVRYEKNKPAGARKTRPTSNKPISQKNFPKAAKVFLKNICQGTQDQARFKAYLIFNKITGEPYIGVTKRKLESRWKQHIRDALNGAGYLLHDVMRHDDFENFEFKYLACARSESDLYKLEVQLIEQYDSVARGYNQTRGGSAGEATGTEVTVDGKSFISINSAARHYGVEEWSVHQRMTRYKWTIEQALEIVPAPQKPIKRKAFIVEDTEYPSFSSACRAYNLKDSNVRARLGRKWTIRQAFEIDPPPENGRNIGTTFVVAGQKHKSINGAAMHYGLNPCTVRYRLSEGYTSEEAVGLETRQKTPPKGKSIHFKGVEYPSIAGLCREYGKDSQKVVNRLGLKWTIEQALDIEAPPPPSGEKNGIPVCVAGTEYRVMLESGV
jgi:hypothetical protein